MEEAKDWAATCSQLREENARLQEYCQKLHVENLELHKALREGAFEKYAPMIASYVSDGKLVEENARLREIIEHAHDTSRHFMGRNPLAAKYFLHICDILKPHVEDTTNDQ
jgi:hypothetical protein